MQGSWRNNYQRYRGFFKKLVLDYQKKPGVMMFLEILLTFSTITILSLFAIRPTFITITELVKEIETKEDLIGVMDKKIRNLDTAQALVYEQSKQINLLNSAIPTGPSVESLSSQIEGLITSTGATIDSFSIEKVEYSKDGDKRDKREKDSLVPTEAKKVTFSIRSAGKFDILRKLIENTEQMRRPALIESLSFSQNSSDEELGKIFLTLSAQVPYIEIEIEE